MTNIMQPNLTSAGLVVASGILLSVFVTLNLTHTVSLLHMKVYLNKLYRKYIGSMLLSHFHIQRYHNHHYLCCW